MRNAEMPRMSALAAYIWRPVATSRRARFVAVLLVAVYVAVFCYLLAPTFGPKPHHHHHHQQLQLQRQYRNSQRVFRRDRLNPHQQISRNFGVDAENPRLRDYPFGIRKSDSGPEAHAIVQEAKARSLSDNWLRGLGWWLWGAGRHPVTDSPPCAAGDCLDFRFPAELPENVRNVCRQDGPPGLSLVVVVSSSADGFEERQALRDTWLRVNMTLSRRSVRHLFVVGHSDNVTVQSLLQQEVLGHADILQGSFSDSAFTSPIYRALLGLYWASRHCQQASHVLKVDQDAWINLPHLLALLRHSPLLPPVGLAGWCTDWAQRQAASQHRARRYPPYVRHLEEGLLHNLVPQQPRAGEEEEDRRSPPPLCHEAGYVTTPAVAGELARASQEVALSTTLENLYLGRCLRWRGLSVASLPGFSFAPEDSFWIADLCELHGQRVLLRRGFTPREMRFIWAESKCRGRRTGRKRRRLTVGLPV